MTKLRTTLALLSVAALAACGGGGGTDPAPAANSPATPAATTTVASLVPGAGMNWITSSSYPFALSVVGADGRPAGGVGVRIFTLSWDDPHGGARLEFPVPLALLDTVLTDASGQALLDRAWPAHVDELLVVASDGPATGQQVVRLRETTVTTLRLDN